MNATASLAAVPGLLEAVALPEDAVEVGRVLGAWGIKGGIKVKPFAADPQALFSSKRWYVQLAATSGPPSAAAASSSPGLLHIVIAKEHGDGVVATAQELPDRNAAEALKGARIFIARGSFPTPDDGEFYWVDLIGLEVLNREGQRLGAIASLLETGPHCVLCVQPAAADAAEVLFPFVDAYVDKVDLPARRVLVDWQADY